MKPLLFAVTLAFSTTLIVSTAEAGPIWTAIKIIFSPVQTACDPDPRWC